MNKKDYNNTINLQVLDLANLVGVQTDICFNEEKLLKMMSVSEFAKIKRVIISGCGDSYSAGGVMAPIIKQLGDFDSTESPDPMEYSTFFTKEDTLDGLDTDEVLVISISASGNSKRIIDILERAKSHGVKTMLITNNPESIGAKIADVLYHVETPSGLNSPGFRSYFANLIALAGYAAYTGVCKNKLPSEDFTAMRDSIKDYVGNFLENFENIDDIVFELAKVWKNFTKIEVIGDDSDYYTSQFIEEKFIECAGIQSHHFDTEDWCHVSFFLRNPKSIGTILVGSKYSPSFSRFIDTVKTAQLLGRPVFVTSDAPSSVFPEGVTAVTLPKPPTGLEWLMTLVNYAPGSMLAAYCAALEEKFFFAGRYDFRNQVFLK